MHKHSLEKHVKYCRFKAHGYTKEQLVTAFNNNRITTNDSRCPVREHSFSGYSINSYCN